MIQELDTVVLVKDLEEYQLTRGDVGAVVHVYEGGKALEVEFVTGEGKTIAVVTLRASDIRPMQRADILHVREFAPA
ncbi:MAG TPA: DUF4926 domain-containing protein [Anaerolineales bacterium]|jgi:hypothetical protein|nr:DUF4926 domain-containing protein [Anaerolineales bacterium]